MNTSIQFRSLHTLLIVLLSGALALAGCNKKTEGGAPSSVTDANLQQKIEQANTPSDHRDLATYYDSLAETAQNGSTNERERREQYERRWRAGPHPMGPATGPHFDGLAVDHESSAGHYRAMAQWHRQMADEAERTRTHSE
ncbi:MAG: hypothetical protein AB7T07_08765 [Steroidobacteraceae bacterium]